MSLVKVSDYIFSVLKDKGYNDIFLVTGGGSMHLNDSIRKLKMNYICNHHEQASAMAAESYARVKNDLGICVVTTGPGGTNTITGVAGAWLDSIPVLFISGQVKTNNLKTKYVGLRQYGVQELGIVEIVRSITKYAVMVDKPEDIKYHLEKAIYLAKNGRKGPVWLDIPLDIQGAIINTDSLRDFDPKEVEEKLDRGFLKNQIDEVICSIKKAKRPIIVAGLGIRMSNAHKEFRQLIDKLNIPVVTSLRSHDVIPSDHPLFAGRFGTIGDRSGNFTVHNSDLVIVLKARLTLRDTGYETDSFAPNAKKIVVDIDKSIFDKPTLKPHLGIVMHVKEFINELLIKINSTKLPDFSSWVLMTKNWQKKYPVALSEYKKQTKFVNSYYFVDILSELMNENSIVVTGVGSVLVSVAQAIKIKEGQRLCVNIGCASMGYDLPAVIGAYFASHNKRIILITGDGSLMMNLQELQTIVHHKFPVKIFVINNKGYHAIRTTQKTFFNSEYMGSSLETGLSFPDFIKISKAFKIPGIQIKNHKNIKNKLKKILKRKGPVFCEVLMDPDQLIIPKSVSVMDKNGKIISKPLADMYPFLNREELKSNMII